MNPPAPVRRKSAWRQLFSLESSSSQRVFDFIFGVVAPTLCLISDPLVFRAGLGPCSTALLGPWAVFAYAAIGLGTILLAGWLIAPHLYQPVLELIAGVFATGTLFAAGLGLVLLPFSAIGLLAFGLGLIGFIPFVTAFVCLRNARQAWRQARARHPEWSLAGRLALAAAGLAVTVLLPAIAQSQAAWLLPGSVSVPAECSSNTVD